MYLRPGQRLLVSPDPLLSGEGREGGAGGERHRGYPPDLHPLSGEGQAGHRLPVPALPRHPEGPGRGQRAGVSGPAANAARLNMQGGANHNNGS